MKSRLPIIVSVPHGGEIIAPEISDQTLLSRSDIFSDGDPLTREIYNFKNEVAYYFESTIARATIDLNRSPDDLPPLNRDGVVKSHTLTGKVIYRKNHFPSKDTLRVLFKKYYKPYHEGIESKSKNPFLFCGIDCHTMLETAPNTRYFPQRRRPFICLSNRGDKLGNKVIGRRLTCPPEMIRSLSWFIKEQFPEEEKDIRLNDPFLGGHIVRHHSKKLPWIQIELNRKSYLSQDLYNPENLEVCYERIAKLRGKLLDAIRGFVRYHDQPTIFCNHVA